MNYTEHYELRIDGKLVDYSIIAKHNYAMNRNSFRPEIIAWCDTNLKGYFGAFLGDNEYVAAFTEESDRLLFKMRYG